MTTFVARGFLDEEIWYWWDRVEYVIDETSRSHAALDTERGPMGLVLADPHDRMRETARVVERCKALRPQQVEALPLRLASALEVDLPRRSPARYAPMAWNDVRRWESRGFRFGRHTVRHPILARCSDEESLTELQGAWTRLAKTASDPDPMFCYPNGQPGDFGPREFEVLADLGYLGG